MGTVAAGRPRASGSRYELWAWLFMRVSGVALVLLAFGHLVLMHVVYGVEQIDYDLVASRLTGPAGIAWRVYDLLLLLLALLHALNGLRVILGEHVRSARWRRVSLWLVVVAGAVFLALGAAVLFAFTPTLS